MTRVSPTSVPRIAGRGSSPPHDQVLRNQSVGRRWMAAGSGPRFVTVMRIAVSVGFALAYSTSTSK